MVFSNCWDNPLFRWGTRRALLCLCVTRIASYQSTKPLPDILRHIDCLTQCQQQEWSTNSWKRVQDCTVLFSSAQTWYSTTLQGCNFLITQPKGWAIIHFWKLRFLCVCQISPKSSPVIGWHSSWGLSCLKSHLSEQVPGQVLQFKCTLDLYSVNSGPP